MSEETLKQQKVAEATQEAGQVKVEKQNLESAISKLANAGGFNLIKSILPEAEKLDPRSKASRTIFLSEKVNEVKRKRLAKDIESWIELLEQDKKAVEMANICDQNQKKFEKLFRDNIFAVLEKIKPLETEYRTLDTFYKNIGTDKASKLRIINVDKTQLGNSDSEFFAEVDYLLKNGYDRLSLKDSYSIIAMPGHIFQNKPILLKWAEMAHKYKALLISDHADERDYDSLIENIEQYRDSDNDLQNVILCSNYLLGREAEKLIDEEEGLYIPPSAALAGMLYDESVPMSQGRAGKQYGTLQEVKGTRLDLLVSQIKPITEKQVVPFVFSEGRVMAFNNSTLYNGSNDAMKEYPIVRVFDWIKKVLINFLNDEVMQNWDTLVSPEILKAKIQKFLNEYKGYGKFFQDYKIGEPIQGPNKEITVDLEIKPYFAAKNFIVKLSANKEEKKCDIS
jgi:hypothetical protein